MQKLSPTELDRLNTALSENLNLMVVVDNELQERGIWIWDTDPDEEV